MYTIVLIFHSPSLIQVEIAGLQEAHETELRQLRTQLEEHVVSNQQLTAQLSENEERLREKEERLREGEERERELLAQLQRKEAELEAKKAEISRLQRSADISKLKGNVEVR